MFHPMRNIVFILCIVLLHAAVWAREVDVELVLAVDVSRSMSPAELEVQRRGYAEALGSDEVIKAIEGGLLGRIALTYVELTDAGSNRVIVPWAQVSNATQARAITGQIATLYDDSLRRTSLSPTLRIVSRITDSRRCDA